ncbi:hypothetical protein [Piscirickettsia salmonis]|uniref:hypothetical protein n=2 Tax=Piscirickettsia salmonis TaxID=1238 RepID=UPI0012B7AFF9|nr:hypothetical protein [Piscirickettsia salmonis]QGN79266.1 hypothetical protein Psal001_03531 [Piscirickettsia salmonis]WGZ73240.1 hypothetical protein E3220_16715 [Piscirickettsia salmonis]
MTSKVTQLDQEPPEKRLALLIVSERYSKGKYDVCMDLNNKIQSRINRHIKIILLGIFTIFICNVIAAVSLWFGVVFVALFLCAIWLSVTNDVKTQMLILDEAEENLQANEQINQLIHGELKNKAMEIIK